MTGSDYRCGQIYSTDEVVISAQGKYSFHYALIQSNTKWNLNRFLVDNTYIFISQQPIKSLYSYIDSETVQFENKNVSIWNPLFLCY